MSAMWSGRLERLLLPPRCRASCSIELISPTSSRRLASSMSRKCFSSLERRPAWFLAGFKSVGIGAGMLTPFRSASLLFFISFSPLRSRSIICSVFGSILFRPFPEPAGCAVAIAAALATIFPLVIVKAGGEFFDECLFGEALPGAALVARLCTNAAPPPFRVFLPLTLFAADFPIFLAGERFFIVAFATDFPRSFPVPPRFTYQISEAPQKYRLIELQSL